MEGLCPRPVPGCMPLVIASAAVAAAGSASFGQSLTPQPFVQTMERISVVGPGQVDAQGAPLTETAKGRLSELPWISPHGRFVVFSTAANTLDRAEDETAQAGLPFTGSDTGGMDVYLVDRSRVFDDEARVRRLSRRENDQGTPNRGSSFGVIDDGGTVAVFQSKGTNLDPNVGNEGSSVGRKVYMVDLTTGQSTLISRDADDIGRSGAFPAVSGDGKYVFFSSGSSNIPKPDGEPFASIFNNNDADLFRYDRLTGEFALVTQASTRRDRFPAASYDGDWVAIESEEDAAALTFLPLGDDNHGNDIFLVQGASVDGSAPRPTFPVSLSLTPDTMGARASRFPAVSDDGRFVAFVSWADDLVEGDGLGNPDTFLRDMGADPSTNTGPTVRVSVGGSTADEPIVMNDAESGCAWGCRPSVVHIPADGVNPGLVVVAFVTLASFDEEFDDNGAWDVYVRVMRADDLACGDTYLASAPAHDSEGDRAAADFASFNSRLRAERIHPDTQDPDTPASMLTLRVAFESYATNLDQSMTNSNDTRDIYYSELIVPIPESCTP